MKFENNDFLTLLTHHHLAFVSSLSTDLKFLYHVVISLDKMTIASDKLKFLTYLNDSQLTLTLNSILPLHLCEDVIFPLYVVPALILVVCTLVFAWRLHKGCARYRQLSARAREAQRRNSEAGVEENTNA